MCSGLNKRNYPGPTNLHCSCFLVIRKCVSHPIGTVHYCGIVQVLEMFRPILYIGILTVVSVVYFALANYCLILCIDLKRNNGRYDGLVFLWILIKMKYLTTAYARE